jgi:protoheme IX farnesyltransferase
MKIAIARLYSVFKIRIGLAIMLSALAGLAATPGPSLPAWQVVVLALAVLASSAAAGAFNQYLERDLDARMARTRTRPFVTGEYAAGPAWLIGILALLAVAVGAAALALNGFVALYVLLGAFVYGVAYTVWLKRRTAWNIVIGGLAGSFAVLAGAAAVDPTPGPVALALAVALFLWTPPHFWSLATALREDYAAAGVPMLPVVVGDRAAARIILAHTLAVVAASLVPAAFGMGWVYTAAATGGGALFIVRSVALVRAPGREAAMRNFHASLIQLALLLLGTIVDGGLRG